MFVHQFMYTQEMKFVYNFKWIKPTFILFNSISERMKFKNLCVGSDLFII